MFFLTLFHFLFELSSQDIDILRYEHVSPPYATAFSLDNLSPKSQTYLPQNIAKYILDEYGNLPVMTYSDFYSMMLILDENGNKLTYLYEITEKSTMYIVDFEPEKYYNSNNPEKAKVYKSTFCNRKKCVFDNYIPVKGVFKIDAVKNFSINSGTFEVFWNINPFQKIPLIFEEIPGGMCGDECTENDIQYWNFKKV